MAPVYRRGRSQTGFTFVRQALAPAIRSKHPYAFTDAFLHQNQPEIHREDTDLVFRGQIYPPPCVDLSTHVPMHHEEDELTDTESIAETLPSPPLSIPMPTRPSTPEAGPTSEVEHLTSPLTPLPPTLLSRKGSPTVSGRRLITYSRHDKNRAHSEREDAAKVAAAKKKLAVQKITKKRAARSLRSPTRSSGHLWRDRPYEGLHETENLLHLGYDVHELGSDAEAVTPLIDKRDYVMGVIAGAPKNESAWWALQIKHAAQCMARLHRNGEFDVLPDQESRVRFGIGFGQQGPHAHMILRSATNFGDLAFIQHSQGFQAISAYQNHLVQQIAPKLYAHLAHQMEQLNTRVGMRPVFKDSIFTTTDIVFCDAPNLCRRNPDAEFYGLEVLTSCGTYDSILRGHIVFPEDHTVIPLRPGATIVFPAGTKRYFFIPVAADETRFLLRQFVHGGVMRWLVKDLRSDASFEDGGSAEELAAWYKTRAARGKNCAKLYSKLQDVYVF